MGIVNPFPKRLRAARLAKGLTQKKLGIAAGIDEFSASPRINQYEQGKHTPDFVTADRLAFALEVPTAYFFAKEDALAEAILIFGKLPDMQQVESLRYLNDLSSDELGSC